MHIHSFFFFFFWHFKQFVREIFYHSPSIFDPRQFLSFSEEVNSQTEYCAFFTKFLLSASNSIHYLNLFLPSLTFQCLIYLTLHLVYNILSESALKTVETFPIFGPFSILSEVSIILPTANSCPQKTTKCKLAGQPYRYRTHLYQVNFWHQAFPYQQLVFCFPYSYVTYF